MYIVLNNKIMIHTNKQKIIQIMKKKRHFNFIFFIVDGLNPHMI